MRALAVSSLSAFNIESQLYNAVDLRSRFAAQLYNLRRYDNVITVIKGTKRIVLFDPSSAPALHFNGCVDHVAENGVLGFRKQGSIAHFSALKVRSGTNATAGAKRGAGSVVSDGGQCAEHDATKTTFPDGVRDGVHPATVTISAGEALFVPAGWAHQVTSAPPTGADSDGLHVAVNVWFAPPYGKRLQRGDEF
eukprot:COSAG02_NODE_140_length_34374_cov_913.416443_10_plen_194_part_00